jgi:small subunit ribosomal protein S4
MQRKLSDYGVQLREKQKMRRIYGVREGQFRNYMKEATRRTGVTGENMLQLLEMRLDNVVYRLGLATSRAQARQFVSHEHIAVDGKRVNIASYQVKPGEAIEVVVAARKVPPLVNAVEAAGGRARPTWLQFDAKQFRGEILSAPSRDEIDTDVQESLIVEFYSR